MSPRCGYGPGAGLRRRVAAASGIACLVVAGCFGESPVETVTDPPRALVLVQGVMRPDQPQQFVLLERTFNGTADGDGTGVYLPGPVGVPVPVEGADVTLSNLSFASDPCGADVPMTETAGPPDRRAPGAYFSSVGCPTMRPGDTIQIVVLDGSERAVGRTVIPGAESLTLTTAGGSFPMPGPQLEFNRDTDTLGISVEATSGRILLAEVFDRRFFETGGYLAFESAQVWVDGEELDLPGNLLNLLTQDVDLDDDVPSLFNAGRYQALTVAWGDEAFLDQLRSGNNPITGRGFINRIDGGYGLFGSLVAARTNLRVVGNVDDPREGTYRMTGRVATGTDSASVDVTWELYLNDPILVDGAETGRIGLSSFVLGDWVLGPYDAYTEGTFADDRFESFLVQPTGGTTSEGEPELEVWELSASFDAGVLSEVRVAQEGFELGRLSVTRR